MSDSLSYDAQSDLKTHIREKYEGLAGGGGGCCGSGASDVVSIGESYADVEGYAAEADLGLGCGLPTEVAALQPGETVLDLGSGAGVDAFVARRAVGLTGRVFGVDFAPAMIEKAQRNAKKLGYGNVEFLHGEIEALPVADESTDVVISNCVLNLVPDKAQAFREVFRVLRPDGRFIISDIVSTGTLPQAIRGAAELYAGCVAGALPRGEYLSVIEQAGFAAVTVAKEYAIDLPDEVLRPHLDDEALEAFRRSDAALLSVTVAGAKPGA